jgi:hypothetical protein
LRPAFVAVVLWMARGSSDATRPSR